MVTKEIKPEKFIGTQLRLKLTDLRVLDGVLTVVDPFGNLLLSNVFELSEDRLDRTNLHKRELGLVSVPRDTITNVLVDRRTHKSLLGP
ncbi:uncharacterized protein AC631_00500 [Debaryomyces fabryi]|uniref:Sm domain-containing protein n=1 Tax=Debaryomyces fabryi TaxID=58627 RepID=A0A0V1Q5C1_9ASCO|nr:uncharacterized protein AC631_00500 [Debaryomyces fabryi]KSA03688.1 hypothetical protein AC631_00500 [Debaryomyces fabryi]CUM53446.1 unnamed protein product [Debaryomyces fabryi]